MNIFSVIISLFLLLTSSTVSASDFNFDTGLALKSDLADKATITSMHKYNNRIVAVGIHGIILTSNDMGSTWIQAEEVPFTNTLTDVQCVSDSQCWAVGHDLTILHSVDGGKNWVIQYNDIDFDAPLLSIHMIDYLNGITVGAFGTSMTTNDGGENWLPTVVTDDAYEPHLNSVYSSYKMKSENGIITHSDLKNYKSIWRKPIIGYYRGHQIISMGPPSSGGIALMQLLQGTANYPIANWGHNSAKTIHLMTELERRVYADRATYLGDPAFVNIPIEELLDSVYNQRRYEGISFDKATPSALVSAGEIPLNESPETTHLSVVDGHGNAVSITTTLNSSFGNKVMVQGAGFFLNNEMDDFSSKPGSPNLYGLIGGEANAIAPNKRMLSSMTPTIVTYNDKLKMVLGTPGGSTIITSVYQTLLNVIDHGMGMQEAVNAKRVHHQWYPDEIRVETDALSNSTQAQLEDLGHRLRMTDKIGRMDCILVLPDGRLEGGADPRGDNTALGY